MDKTESQQSSQHNGDVNLKVGGVPGNYFFLF